jgi:hypothetical protein
MHAWFSEVGATLGGEQALAATTRGSVRTIRPCEERTAFLRKRIAFVLFVDSVNQGSRV